MRYLIMGRALLTGSRDGGAVRVRAPVAVLVAGDRIQAVGASDRLRRAFPRVPRLGGDGAILLPGLVNAHSHGMGVTDAELGTPDLPLELWAIAHLGRPKPPRRPETALAALRQLAAGITTTVHSQGGGGAADAGEILRGYADAGIRTVFALHARNQNRIAYEADGDFLSRLPPGLRARVGAAFAPPPDAEPARWWESFAALVAGHEGPRITLACGPAGVQWVDPAFLRALSRRARREGRLLHTHLLESPYERLYGPRTLGSDTVPWLRRQGVLGPHVTGAHAVWTSPRDLGILAAAGASLIHCPSSNLRLASGRMPLHAALSAGVNVALGVDSLGLNDDDDLFTEMRLARRLHAVPGIPGARLTASDVLLMATRAGARSIGRDDLGTVERGQAADLCLLDGDAIDPRRALSGHALLDAVVTRARPAHVRLTMVGGEVLWDGRRHPRLSAARLVRAARAVAPERAELVKLRRPLSKALQRFYEGWRLPERRRTPRRW